MNTEYFIARRFIKSQKGNRKYTTPIIRLSVVAIALSLTVMILSVSIVTGFKKEIRNKVIGFGGHIQITNFDSNNSYESSPIDRDIDFLDELKELPGLKNIQSIATKPALIKTKKEIQGVIMKGIDTDFDTTFFVQNLIEGRMVKIKKNNKTNDILISKKLSDLLNLKLGDKFIAYFIDKRVKSKPVNQRVFKICGIYQTSLETFDEKFIFGDIKHIQTFNNWEDYQIGGFEILIDDYDNLDFLTWEVRNIVESRFLPDGSQLQVTNIKSKNPHIFDWLDLLDMNVFVILIIMIGVAIIDMVSGLIILILDRTPSIGLLKALGTNNTNLQKIFLYQAGYLILQGMLYGNVIALSIIFLEDKFHILKLDQASYFIDYAPVNFNLWHLAIINFGALISIFIFMLLPVIIVARIEPVKTLRYS
jgi:lipoprotein-releasing system permease protein